jgi:hypothetical protein
MANDRSGKYFVGHGRPPEHTRFKKGQSGNPRGRPKAANNLKTDVMEEMREKVVVREGEHPRKISKQRAIVKTLYTQTIRGNVRAANTLFSILDPEGEPAVPSRPLNTEEREVLEAVKARLLGDDYAGDTTADDPDTTEGEP